MSKSPAEVGSQSPVIQEGAKPSCCRLSKGQYAFIAALVSSVALLAIGALSLWGQLDPTSPFVDFGAALGDIASYAALGAGLLIMVIATVAASCRRARPSPSVEEATAEPKPDYSKPMDAETRDYFARYEAHPLDMLTDDFTEEEVAEVWDDDIRPNNWTEGVIKVVERDARHLLPHFLEHSQRPVSDCRQAMVSAARAGNGEILSTILELGRNQGRLKQPSLDAALADATDEEVRSMLIEAGAKA